jgi:hypothetical protein
MSKGPSQYEKGKTAELKIQRQIKEKKDKTLTSTPISVIQCLDKNMGLH